MDSLKMVVVFGLRSRRGKVTTFRMIWGGCQSWLAGQASRCYNQETDRYEISIVSLEYRFPIGLHFG